MNWEEFKMSLITDLQNMFIGVGEKENNVLVDFLANGNITNLSENACRDVLHLSCINMDIKSKFTICKYMIKNNCYIDLAVNEFAATISAYPELIEQLNDCNIINDIIEYSLYLKLNNNTLFNLIDCLEMLYAYGCHKYIRQIILLYKKIDSDVKSLQYKDDVIRAKLAILSYGANKYNASENCNKIYEIYKYISKAKRKYMQGMVYYYYGVFYRRTNYQEKYISLKKGYSYMPYDEALFEKSKSHGFWLANIII